MLWCFLWAFTAVGSPEKGPDGRFLPLGPGHSVVLDASDLDPSADGSFELVDLRGSRQLHVRPEFIHLARDGMDLIYDRRYTDARQFFSELEGYYPGTGVAAVADVLVWQAKMFENYDFRYDAQYKVATRVAREQLNAALKDPGNEGWEHFMMAGVSGIDAIHAARQQRYLPALALAFEAIDHIEGSRDAAPDFVDLDLADGMYNYWRTVITRRSKILPNFGDYRELGIQQMKEVEHNGVFLSGPATLSLAFSYYEEKRYDDAINACEKNRASYPRNTINLMMLGAIHLKAKRYSEALTVFEGLTQRDPTNNRAIYYIGLTHHRAKNYPAAHEAYEAYLSREGLEKSQQAWTHYRLGMVAKQRAEVDSAEQHLREAVRLGAVKPAKKELDNLLDEKKKKGRTTR